MAPPLPGASELGVSGCFFGQLGLNLFMSLTQE